MYCIHATVHIFLCTNDYSLLICLSKLLPAVEIWNLKKCDTQQHSARQNCHSCKQLYQQKSRTKLYLYITNISKVDCLDEKHLIILTSTSHNDKTSMTHEISGWFTKVCRLAEVVMSYKTVLIKVILYIPIQHVCYQIFPIGGRNTFSSFRHEQTEDAQKRGLPNPWFYRNTFKLFPRFVFLSPRVKAISLVLLFDEGIQTKGKTAVKHYWTSFGLFLINN